MPRGHKGEPRTPGSGRKKGSENKMNAEIKDMIRAALNAAHEDGGQAYLVKQAKENPTAFMTLIGKIIPSDVNNHITGAVKVDGTINFIRPAHKV